MLLPRGEMVSWITSQIFSLLSSGTKAQNRSLLWASPPILALICSYPTLDLIFCNSACTKPCFWRPMEDTREPRALPCAVSGHSSNAAVENNALALEHRMAHIRFNQASTICWNSHPSVQSKSRVDGWVCWVHRRECLVAYTLRTG